MFILYYLKYKREVYARVIKFARARPSGSVVSLPDDHYSVLLQGRRRVKILETRKQDGFHLAYCCPIDDEVKLTNAMKGLIRSTKNLFERVVSLDRKLPDESYGLASSIDDPIWLADMIMTTVTIPRQDRLAILQEADPVKRLPDGSGKPAAVIAHTVKGKGVSFMEDDNNWHYRIPSEEETEAALRELV